MEYKSILEYSENEYIVEKSKFISYIKPVNSENQAKEFIEKIKKENWDATHNVPVYIIGEQMQVQKFSDDGEPSGTAGLPILEMLKKENITNVAVVITRYFGGIKLGKGGLIRAYQHSAKLGLKASKVIKYKEFELLELKYEYTFNGKIENFLKSNNDIYDYETKFLESVERKIYVPLSKKDECIGKLIDITNNNIKIKELSSGFLSIYNGKLIGGE